MGSRDGNILSEIVFDEGVSASNNCTYSPNIIYLNKILTEWAVNEIRFEGVFHTHAPQWSTLSKQDENYIIYIYSTMPSYIKCLYFPIVFPGIGVRSYKAVRVCNEIKVVDDDVEII